MQHFSSLQPSVSVNPHCSFRFLVFTDRSGTWEASSFSRSHLKFDVWYLGRCFSAHQGCKEWLFKIPLAKALFTGCIFIIIIIIHFYSLAPFCVIIVIKDCCLWKGHWDHIVPQCDVNIIRYFLIRMFLRVVLQPHDWLAGLYFYPIFPRKLLFKAECFWAALSETWRPAHPPVRISFHCIFVQLLGKWTLINIIDEGTTELKIDILHTSNWTLCTALWK